MSAVDVTGGPRGEWIDRQGERVYVVRNVDAMPPFFMNIVSGSDHWLFVSSTGALSCGRVSPDNALFPYVTVDKIHDSPLHTGCKTIVRLAGDRMSQVWEPFNAEQNWRYTVERHLYKNALGTRVCFEEVNRDLGLTFRYTWETSDQFGFSRHCELENHGHAREIEVLDGIQNILPAGTPPQSQASTSNLVDAYKWNELYSETGLAIFTLYAGISDRAAPSESLRANTVFSLGLDHSCILISSRQLNAFRSGAAVTGETHTRGIRGAYFVNARLSLAAGKVHDWRLVANVELSQSEVAGLQQELMNPDRVTKTLTADIESGNANLLRIVARADAIQATAEESVTAHHLANVLFNIMRGGIFNDQYAISREALKHSIRHFNRGVYEDTAGLLEQLPAEATLAQIIPLVRESGNLQLERLCCEYLPLTFGRRHGDPSRPWNHFTIKLRDTAGKPLLSYEGNWRDIFQNWEALLMSYPEFIESTIARFVNASTVDGHNPYRITSEGIDWEVEDLRDPWSYIGYWGDHQIIYLLKLLELSEHFHPNRLHQLLSRETYCYANVPYRIQPFDKLLEDPKNTVLYDKSLARTIATRVDQCGADGRLLWDEEGQVYQVNLLEKLLVPLLAKLGNLVVGGGIWLNTQRPEWNDANNAIVGNGLSMVTLYYLRRYVLFVQRLITGMDEAAPMSNEVIRWMGSTNSALTTIGIQIAAGEITPAGRYDALQRLGEAASHYRDQVYRHEGFSGKSTCPPSEIDGLLSAALGVIDYSIHCNKREDGLYHAYNLLIAKHGELEIENLYPMLEGQVAVLSSGALTSAAANELLKALFNSDMYREDQRSFMLYPDRALTPFLRRNCVDKERIDDIPVLKRMIEDKDPRIIAPSVDGCYRFNADFQNIKDLEAALDEVGDSYGAEVAGATESILALYESVFNHHAFTGRSGTMFGFEGLGCVYWHMVTKLLLAIQENYIHAREHETPNDELKALARSYYHVRDGLGFNKTPVEYGAIPTDPYSHTPGHSGAQQPGMTGQVKEEILTRFGELGIRVQDGAVTFDPCLLRPQEFSSKAHSWRYMDVEGQWQEHRLPAQSLAFTWCQVPVVYELTDSPVSSVTITSRGGFSNTSESLALDAETSSKIFARRGEIREIYINLPKRGLAKLD